MPCSLMSTLAIASSAIPGLGHVYLDSGGELDPQIITPSGQTAVRIFAGQTLRELTEPDGRAAEPIILHVTGRRCLQNSHGQGPRMVR